jgi:hypothetical protein
VVLSWLAKEDEKLRDSAIETKKGRSAIAVVAQITTIEACQLGRQHGSFNGFAYYLDLSEL